MSKEYYIQDIRSGYVGNSCLWWRKGGMGYGCNIQEAERMSEEEAFKLSKSEKYIAWPCDYIDARISHHIDMQHLEKDESTSLGNG